MLTWIIVGATLAAALAVYAVADLFVPRESTDVRRRLRAVSGQAQQETATVFVDDRPAGIFQQLLLQLGKRAKKEEDQTEAARPTKKRRGRPTLADTLLHAGFRRPDAPAMVRGIQIASAAGLGTAMFAGGMTSGMEAPLSVLAPVGCTVVGYLAPLRVVRRLAKRRSEAIDRTLPDVLDLLVLCVEAGLGLNAAVARVSEERAQGADPIGEELSQLAHELRLGIARRDALRSLGERCGSDDLRAVSAQLVQADRLGSSIGGALRAQAEAVRTAQRLRAEEAANKMSVKMLVPLIFCVMPALLALALVPPGMKLLEVFAGS